MRFKLIEQILIEGIAEVRKQFPNISDDDFYDILRLDPTVNMSDDVAGKYSKWLLTLYKKGENPLASPYNADDLLKQYDALKKDRKYTIEKDINKFKSLKDLYSAIDNVSMAELSNRQKERELRTAYKDCELVYQDEDWYVFTPKTYGASCTLGKGTRWCTAYSDDDSQYWYHTKQGPLYVIINKHDRLEKYQYHNPSGQFRDRYDSARDFMNFLNGKPGLNKLFNKLYPNDVIDISQWETFTLKKIGSNYNESIASLQAWGGFIRNLIIDESVDSLQEEMFRGCENIENVEFKGDSVTILPRCIFHSCSKLKNVILPPRLERIENAAFFGTCSLTQINLPQSLRRIGRCAFDISALAEVHLPKSVIIGGFAFEDSALQTAIIDCDNEDYDVYNSDWFNHCSNLRTVSITSEGFKTMPYRMFYGCNNLTTVDLPMGLEYINENAFSRCPKLSYLCIPESVTKIEYNAFDKSNPIIQCKEGSYVDKWCQAHDLVTEYI